MIGDQQLPSYPKIGSNMNVMRIQKRYALEVFLFQSCLSVAYLEAQPDQLPLNVG